MANDNNILGGFIASLGGDETEYPANGKSPVDTYDPYNEDIDYDVPSEADTINPADIAKTVRANNRKTEEKQDVEEDIEDDDEIDNSDLDNDNDDEDEEEISSKKDKDAKSTNKKQTKSDNVIEDEVAVAQGLYEMLSEKFGIDTEEDEYPDSIDSLVERLYDIVEENSVPTYANEDIAKLDEYVKNGGKLEDYFNTRSKYTVSKDDLKTEEGCKKIVSKLLETQGYSKDQITKKIEKYELAGILEDEAEDGFEKLEAIDAREQEKLLENTRKENEEMKARQQKQYDDVVSTIKGLSEVNGITISQKEKKELVKYLFEPTKSGLTQFAEDGKDMKNIVTAAFIMKNGSSLIDSAKKKGKSDAYAKIKEGLRNPKNPKSRLDRFGKTEDVDQSLSTVSTSVNKLFGGPSYN